MKLVDFTREHVGQAAKIAMLNYERERVAVPVLPPVENVPDLTPYAKNGLGVAAFEGAAMLGFLCGTPPFKNAFGSTDATGVFSPMGASGVAGDKRAKVYARLYQAAGEKWAGAGAASHAVCLYAHDTEVHQQFFRYGFGLRCVDAIREVEGEVAMGETCATNGAKTTDDTCAAGDFGADAGGVCAYAGSGRGFYFFTELPAEQAADVLPLAHMQDAHMAASPTFILRPSDTPDSYAAESIRNRSVFFVARYYIVRSGQRERNDGHDRNGGHGRDGGIVAYIKAELDGENFIRDTPGYFHVKGAFCLPEHRGLGLHWRLLRMLETKLKARGYTRLGVDFESINPAAYGFWLKDFTAYTYGIVRRIDERAVLS